jgi:hypothetical protein
MAAILVASRRLRKPLPTSCTTLFKVRKYLFLGENLRNFGGSEASWLTAFGGCLQVDGAGTLPHRLALK